MQNSSQRFPGASVAGDNYSEHSYQNHRGSHCQPGYQTYSSPYNSPRQHYANHHQQMPTYRQHYPPQPQYTVGPQEVYRYPHNGPQQNYRHSWVSPNYLPENGMPAYPAESQPPPAYPMENGMPPAYAPEAGPLHSLQKMVMHNPKEEFFPGENGEPTYFNLDENRPDPPFFPPDSRHPDQRPAESAPLFQDQQQVSEQANSNWTPNALPDPRQSPLVPAQRQQLSTLPAAPDSEQISPRPNSVGLSSHDWTDPPLQPPPSGRSPGRNEVGSQRTVTEEQNPLRDCEPEVCSSSTPSPCSLFPNGPQNSESRMEDSGAEECESVEKTSIRGDTPLPKCDPGVSADPTSETRGSPPYAMPEGEGRLPSLEDISHTPVKVMLHRIRKHGSGTWHIPENGCTEDECSPRKAQRRISRGRGIRGRRRGSTWLRRSPIRVTKQREKKGGPFVRMSGSASFVVVNGAQQQQPEERRRAAARAPLQVGHSSTLSPTYDAFNRDKTWVCVFCRRGSHMQGLGDLYGPYFVRDGKAKRRRKRKMEPPDAETGQREVWLHEDCAVWSQSVTLLGEEVRGLQEASEEAADNACCGCNAGGATLGCWAKGCRDLFHFCCARDAGCQMNAENFSLLCKKHQQVKARKA